MGDTRSYRWGREAEFAPSAEPSPEPPAKVEFQITVTTKGEAAKVGLDIIQLEDRYLKIRKVKEGVVMDWNKANSDKEVKVNDCIVAVNGITGSAKKMLEEIKIPKTLELTISR